MALGPQFKVRFCNIKANGVQSHPGAQAPFCVRGNFDGRVFNTEYFHGTSMAPMWATDLSFDFQAPTIDSLASKYLVLECYGGDTFLGMCRIDLLSLARGSPVQCLDLADGARIAGALFFEVHMDLMCEVAIRFNRLSLSQIAPRGYESEPNPYITFGLADGGSPVESPIAAGSQRPEWKQLPPLYFRGSFRDLCNARILFDLKHSRNGYTAGVNDPLMGSFTVAMENLPITPGRDQQLPLRDMVHSAPNYPFAFSADLMGAIELRNVHSVAQSNEKRPALSGTESRNQMASPNVSPGVSTQFGGISPRPTSPVRGGGGGFPRYSGVQQLHQLQTTTALSPPRSPINSAIVPHLPTVAASSDIGTLETVATDQSQLLLKVQQRLEDVRRRKQDVAMLIEDSKRAQDTARHSSGERRAVIEADLRAAIAERQRQEDSLFALRKRVDEEKRTAEQRAVDRERARRALEEERTEAQTMQERVMRLRDEMQSHLGEEERRYQQRLRDAEDARRRTLQDSAALSALEQRLVDTEGRVGRR